jgi:hypothetical protein
VQRANGDGQIAEEGSQLAHLVPVSGCEEKIVHWMMRTVP